MNGIIQDLIMYVRVSSEGNVQYTNIKYIQQNISNITDTINGLAFDTLYRVGVVLLSEDGNFNEEIKTAQYMTTCYEPVDVIYDLMLHSNDPKTITATWKKHTRRNETECKIYYHLTLKFNHTIVSENQISEVPNMVNFTNVLPGYLYTVEIRAYTALGAINLTEVAHTSTEPNKGNIIIRNIIGKADAFNQSVRLTWELANSLIGDSINYTIKYKNLENDTQTVDDTEINTKEYVNLNPNTKYEIQIYIKNNNGYNPDYMLAIPFKMKAH
ncbi:uncharacterized protein LOC126837427 [Adelges cooleyi]|uniref:uncharacterized protein LOC126837427 n=1 Tax=Adelges cooleyi TaxID=133065 RepID=UPI00217F5820|nr:uncharacterized protein LOC126837427 [Adelges cooleyi]